MNAPQENNNAAPKPAKSGPPVPLLIVGALLLIGGIGLGGRMWWRSQHLVETENAFVAGRLHPVATRVAGVVTEMRMLQALREVDDALAELQGRATTVDAQNRTLSSASQALSVAKSRYDKGAVSYLDVTEAERTPLATERALAQLRGAQWAATAQLVKALGGGWTAKAEASGG